MPLQATSGAASYDAFGGGVAAVPNYIEEVFSTYLYTGNGSTQTITNGIDLSTKGGLTWIKGRSGATGHRFTDTARGVTKSLASNSTAAEVTESTGLTAFGTTGFTIGADADYNTSAATYASWTFRKQPKFFDVVTYTGNGTAGRTVAHSLGSVPGCMIVRPTSAVDDWFVYHRSLLNSQSLFLNLTAAASNTPSAWNSTTPTSTEFTVGTNTATNANGVSYVAYLFAHNAGGFGLTGTDNVISCGSFSDDASGNATVNLGFEPQWILQKQSNSVGNWFIADVMRGMAVGVAANLLRPNLSSSESAGGTVTPTATGFTVSGYPGSGSYIYIAIRRGPMKVPTSGTSVFVPYAYTGNGSATRDYSAIGIVTDMNWTSCRSNNVSVSPLASTRLLGNTTRIQISAADVEATGTYGLTWNAYQNGVQGNAVFGGGDGWNTNAYTYIGWNFRRAPSFFDIVCYTGTGANRTVTHNLSAVPELMLIKRRSTVGESWAVYSVTAGNTKFLRLNDTLAATTSADRWNNTTPTSSVFTVGIDSEVNASGETYLNYLFATCAGVSKVGSYTGTGALQTVNCGFTSGARFVFIKRTDSTGDWWTYDSARGITSGNDPYLFLNTTAAEVTSTNYVDTDTTGFKVTAAAPAGLNASGGTYIFLAIA